jgi:dihydrofolate reductase
MRRSLLVAVSAGGVIGRQGALPWRLSADLKRFKRLTLGHPLIMGRKTLESIGRLLPGRTTIVITRQPAWRPVWLTDEAAANLRIAHSLEEALRLAAGDDEVFVIGGGEIYRLALPHADRIYRTLVEADVEGDAFFPELSPDTWQIVWEERHAADEQNEYDYRFQILDRVARVSQ